MGILIIIIAIGALIALTSIILGLRAERAHREWVRAHRVAAAASHAADRAQRKAAWEAAEEALDGIKWKLNWGVPPEEVFAEVELAIGAARALGADTKILVQELGWWRELQTRK